MEFLGMGISGYVKLISKIYARSRTQFIFFIPIDYDIRNILIIVKSGAKWCVNTKSYNLLF